MTIPGPIIVGTAQLGAHYGIANRIGMLDEPAAVRLLQAAWDAGVRAFDTAPGYADAERRLGLALAGCGFWVSTKVPSLRTVPDAALGDAVRRSVEASLDRLGRPFLDVVLVHDVDDLRRGPIVARALEELRQQGHLLQWGASVYEPPEAYFVAGLPGSGALQVPVNLLDRRFEDFVSTSVGRLSVVARSAYLQGAFALPEDELMRKVPALVPWMGRLHRICTEFNCLPLSIALPFVRTLPGIEAVVVGLESAEQLRMNLAALAEPIPEGFRKAIFEGMRGLEESALDPRRWPRLPPEER